MRCHICDNRMDPSEIIYDSEAQEFKPCLVCTAVSKDAYKELASDDPQSEYYTTVIEATIEEADHE